MDLSRPLMGFIIFMIALLAAIGLTVFDRLQEEPALLLLLVMVFGGCIIIWG